MTASDWADGLGRPHIAFGLNRDGFLDQFFERRPCLLRACFDSSRFGWRLIDLALDHQDPSRERFKVLLNGRVDPAVYLEEFMDIGVRRRRIRKERLYPLIAKGATLVLNRVELASEEMRDLCFQVGKFIGAQTTGNAYASMGPQTATNVHWDTHDVFILQLFGRKRWKMFEPTVELPVSSQTSNERKNELPENAHSEVVLEAGDGLYIPRGWWHQVTPLDQSPTIHLTVAIHTPLVLDYLVWACGQIFPDGLPFRRSLIGRQGDAQAVRDALTSAVQMLDDSDTLSRFNARSVERERVVSPFNIHSLLARSGALPSSTRVRLNAKCLVDWGPTSINGKRVALHGTSQEIVDLLKFDIELTILELGNQVSSALPDAIETAVRELALLDLVDIVVPSLQAVPAQQA
jgi:ribosomal protein L16 Arg81 hydroxylase